MLNKALEKINNEMSQSNKDPYIQTVGRFLLQHINANHEDAEKILTADKSIAKSLDIMRQEAQKKQVNRCGMFTPEEGFNIVLKYFGIDKTGTSLEQINQTAVKAQPIITKIKQQDISFDVNLEELLNG
jgi:hypothetical protein